MTEENKTKSEDELEQGKEESQFTDNFHKNAKDLLDNDTSVDEVLLGEFGSNIRTWMAFFSVCTLCILALIMGSGIIISEYRNGEFPNMGWTFNIIIIILGIIGWEYIGVNKTINTLNGFKNGLIGRIVTKRK